MASKSSTAALFLYMALLVVLVLVAASTLAQAQPPPPPPPSGSCPFNGSVPLANITEVLALLAELDLKSAAQCLCTAVEGVTSLVRLLLSSIGLTLPFDFVCTST